MLTEHCRAKPDPSYGGDPDIIPAYIKNGDTQRTVFEAYKDLKNDLYLRMGALGYGIVIARYGSSAYLYYLTLGGEERADGIRCPHGTEIPVVFRKGRVWGRRRDKKCRYKLSLQTGIVEAGCRRRGISSLTAACFS